MPQLRFNHISSTSSDSSSSIFSSSTSSEEENRAMGNTQSDPEEPKLDLFREEEDEEHFDEDDTTGNENKLATIFCSLFADNESLRLQASKIKEKIPEVVLFKHNSQIRKWLHNQHEEVIALAQFCDMLMSLGVERTDAIKIFNQVDFDGSGVADHSHLMDLVEEWPGGISLSELSRSVRALQSCTLTPGFVDIYAGATHPVEKHGAKILKYLLLKRAETKAFPVPYLHTFNNIFVMRSNVLKSLLSSSNSEEEDFGFNAEKDFSDCEREKITNCFTKIEASSNISQAEKLFTPNSTWTSDGREKSHWLRLHVKPNVVIKMLSIGVQSGDRSYMPEVVEVYVGFALYRLHKICEIKIDKHTNGQAVILRNMDTHFPYVQINIVRCHNDGCDTKIHGIKAVGTKYVKGVDSISVMDASVLWYLQMLTTTVTYSLPHSPGLQPALLSQTMKTLEYLPPLSLSRANPDCPAFLNQVVLDQVGQFVEQLAGKSEENNQMSEQGLHGSIALNLAQGSVAKTVTLLNNLIAMPSLELPCAELLSKAFSIQKSCYPKLGRPLAVTFLATDGGDGAKGSPGPAVVLTSHSPTESGTTSSAAYLTDEGKTKCTMIFKSEKNVRLTKIRIYVVPGYRGPKHGLVFVYNPEHIPELSDTFDKDEHLDYFSKYDFWRKKEFDFSVGYREAGHGGMPDNPVAYFHFDIDSGLIDVPVSWAGVGQYILVKFLEPQNESATRLGIISIKFFGFHRMWAPYVKDEKPLAVPNPSKKAICDLPEIVSNILRFMAELAADQALLQRRKFFTPQKKFWDLSGTSVTAVWKLYLACEQRMLNETENSKNRHMWAKSMIMALHLFHGLLPVFAKDKPTAESKKDDQFEKLCDIVNTQTPLIREEDKYSPASMRLKYIKQIIIDGVSLFFPEKTGKRDALLKMIDSNMDESSLPSRALVFKALCQFFSAQDPNGLLNLPTNMKEELPSTTNTLDMMRSLLQVACQKKKRLTTNLSHKTKVHFDNDPSSKDTKEANTSQAKFSEPSTEPSAQVESSVDGPLDQAKSSTGNANSETLASKECSEAKSNKRTESEDVPTDKEAKTISNENSSVVKPRSEVGSGDNNKGAKAKEKQANSAAKTLASGSSDDDDDSNQITYIVKLAASVQAALFSWCWQRMESKQGKEDEKVQDFVNDILLTYTLDVINKIVPFFEEFANLTKEELKQETDQNEPSFVSVLVRQLILLLTSIVDQLRIDTKVTILMSLKRLVTVITDASKIHPEQFSDISRSGWKGADAETTLRTWEVESPHPYENESNIQMTFYNQGATRFDIEFDEHCETESRYDYLEFVDSKGMKKRFESRVDSNLDADRWPAKISFSGPYLWFSFISDSSNSEWGYKFTVKAIGHPDEGMTWLTDTQLGLFKLVGKLCGLMLSSNPILTLENAKSQEDLAGQDILRSALWTTLFRGGYTVGRLQRSLSGKFATGDNGRTHSFLMEVLSVAADVPQSPGGGTEEEEIIKLQAQRYLTKCREGFKAKNKQMLVGGRKVDKAIISMFVALVWHCQEIREDTEKFLNSKDHGEITEGILQAYTSAESLRLPLTNERQKWLAVEEDREKDEDEDPAEVFSSKALYLLKFAGLTKVQLRHDMRSKAQKQMMLKKAGNKMAFVRNDIVDKYPSFRLVMEFVQDPAWTAERVNQLLQERLKYASAISETYMFASEMVRITTTVSPIQLPLVLFFQELLSYQENFTEHYAEGLDGCGLEQESKVRLAYYALIRRLVTLVKVLAQEEKDDKTVSLFDFIQSCLLHFLDTEWQAYDLSFVAEIELPKLYLSIAKETVKMRDLHVTEIDEQEELAKYEQSMAWYEEVKDDVAKWLSTHQTKGNTKECKMFVARFSDVIDIEVICDGCDIALPGRRYRCLQCEDMDLCTACFSGGVEPHGHKDDHDMVHLVYKCDHCQAFIVGTRIHCNQCSDFDLCLGCHSKQKFPQGHTADHPVTKIPMVKLKTCQYSSSSLKAYIHQHVWLLYSSLTLTISDLVYSDNSGATTDSDYIKQAGQLHQQCISQAMNCLSHIVGEPESESNSELPFPKRQEKTFAIHAQERILGLLGAVLPDGNKREHIAGVGFNFWTKEFLDVILKLSRGDGHEMNPQHLALHLLSRLTSKGDNTLLWDSVSDRSIDEGVPPETPMQIGQQIIQRFFQLGQKSFEKYNVEWAASVARMLETMALTPQWTATIHQHVFQAVQKLKHYADKSTIFPLFVIAGFPEVLTTGTLVSYRNNSLEVQRGVVLKHYPDKTHTMYVDLKRRKRILGKDKDLTVQTEEVQPLEDKIINILVQYVVTTVAKIKSDEAPSQETLWVLALVLKVLNGIFKLDKVSTVSGQIFCEAFVQALAYLACKGVRIKYTTLLCHVEIMSLMYYNQFGTSRERGSPVKEKKMKKKAKKEKLAKLVLDSDNSSDDDLNKLEKDDDDKEDSDSSSSDDDDEEEEEEDKDENEDDDDDDDKDSDNEWLDMSDSMCEDMSPEKSSSDHGKDHWEGLNGTQEELMQALNEEMDIPQSVLQAICSMNKGNPDGLIRTLTDSFGNRIILNSLLSKWRAKKKAEKKEKAHQTEEGSSGTEISTEPLSGETLDVPEKAVPEEDEDKDNFFPQQERCEMEKEEKNKTASYNHMKSILRHLGDKHTENSSVDLIISQCVLYSRHTLRQLLAIWPQDGPAIIPSFLGCRDVKQIPCVLDLLYKTESKKFFTKMVDRVIQNCDEASLVPISSAAAHFMEEVSLKEVMKESSHPYTPESSQKDCIRMVGASYLTVQLHHRCETRKNDVLMFASNPEMDKDFIQFSGSERTKWMSFHMPGDTLYYKFVVSKDESTEKKESDMYGYQFTLTQGSKEGFVTGHTILESVLSSPLTSSLSLKELWSCLVHAACKHPGQQRLCVISLMLKIVALQKKRAIKAKASEPLRSDEVIDLTKLKPLWDLYCTMTKDEDAKVIKPAVVRALTNLFVHAEDLASELNMTGVYVASLMTLEDLSLSLVEGFKNVAAIGVMINYNNMATELYKKVGKRIKELNH